MLSRELLEKPIKVRVSSLELVPGMSSGDSRQWSLPFRNKSFITLRKVLMLISRGIIIQKASFATRSFIENPDLPRFAFSKGNQMNLMSEFVRDRVEAAVSS